MSERKRAGVSRPTVYRYVGGQQAITEALLNREVDRYLDAVQTVIGDSRTRHEQFIETVVFTVVYAREHRLLQALLREQPDVVLPWLTTRAEPMLRRGIASMSAYVKRDRSESAAQNKPEVEVEWGIRLVVSLITMPSITRKLDTPTDLRRYVTALLDIGTPAATGNAATA